MYEGKIYLGSGRDGKAKGIRRTFLINSIQFTNASGGLNPATYRSKSYSLSDIILPGDLRIRINN